jgi:pimeloyl-ACP methyl ester carboxylesterase
MIFGLKESFSFTCGIILRNMKKVRRILRWVGIVTVILCIAYLLGPRPETPRFDNTLPEVNYVSADLEAFVARAESEWPVRKDNEARIVWADSLQKIPTDYAIVYLHGFSASQEEGDPVHLTVAKTFGCNLYLSRLSMHGLDTAEQLLGLTADSYWESAKQALAIGRQLGKKVILMGTSTGGTQALQLAAAFPDAVQGLVLLSPNIAIKDPNAWLLNNPWGLQIARMVKGGDYVVAKDTRPIYKRYWNTPYRLEAVVELQEMLESSMKAATFQKITQPLLLMYYYKDENNQDQVVSVEAMRRMFEQVATPHTLKKEVALPKTGDHVIGSYIKSGDVQSVIDVTTEFLEGYMKLTRNKPTVPVLQ